MKILFHNYSNKISTEPLYLHYALKQAQVESEIWANSEISAYDMFDSYKPDVFVTNFQTLDNNTFTYLKKNSGCDLVLNVTDASQSQLNSIELAVKDSGIKVPFVFTNRKKPNIKTDLKLIDLYPAADIFNTSRNRGQSCGVPDAIISDNFDENVDNYICEKSVFHLLYVTDKHSDANFDMRVNAKTLPQLYGIYERMTLIGDINLCSSQLFFDMILNCNKVQVKCSDQEAFNKFIASIFNSDVSPDVDVELEVRNQIKSRHTPVNRAWRLMKYLENKDAMTKLDHMKDELAKIMESF